MAAICVVNGYKRLLSETFIVAQLERLRGDKVVLYNHYPEYTCNGRTLRYFYSRRPSFTKLARLLPQVLYDRWITCRELSDERTVDFMTGFVRDHNVDIFLAQYGFNGADITPVAKHLGLPLVVHCHGHDAHDTRRLAPYVERYREMFDYADRLISVSHTMTESLVALGADRSKIVYNPYGAQEKFFDVQSEYGPCLLAIGRFADIKAPYLTLMAFKVAAERVPRATLVMVGEGPLLEACRTLAKTWGLESRVVFTGALTHEEILPLMGRACAFVQHSVTTSYGDMEGMPNAILEAGAAGLPVLSTRHAGITTCVVEGDTGFLVDERDVAAMTARMCRVLDDASLCRTMGAKARRHIAANYHIARHIGCLQHVIDEVRSNAVARDAASVESRGTITTGASRFARRPH